MFYIFAVLTKPSRWVDDTNPINALNKGNYSACVHFSLDMRKIHFASQHRYL